MKRKMIMYLVLPIVSLILGVSYAHTQSIANQPPCAVIGACPNETIRGSLSVKRYGIPATYREVTNFRPSNSQSYASVSSETRKTNYLLIAANVFFWYALIGLTLTKLAAVVIKRR